MSILLRELITVQWDKILVPFPNLKYIQWYLYYESRRMCILMCLYILSLIILLLILGFIVPPVHIHSGIFPPFPFFFFFHPGFVLHSAFAMQFSFLHSYPFSSSQLLHALWLDARCSVWSSQGLLFCSSRITQSLCGRHTYFC